MKKFVLLPDELYYLWMENQDPDLLPMFETKKSMEKLLSNKALDSSSKKELYSQHLESYLRHKKRLEEKPIRVDVVSGNPSQQQSSRIRGWSPPSTGATPPVTPPGSPNPFNIPNAGNAGGPGPGPGPVNNDPLASPGPRHSFSPQQLRRLRDQALVQKKEFLEREATRIDQFIRQNPNDFNVTRRGEILDPRTKAKLATSRSGDSLFILKNLVGVPELGQPPAGYKNLERILKTNPHTAEMIETAKKGPTGMSGGGMAGYDLKGLFRKKRKTPKRKPVKGRKRQVQKSKNQKSKNSRKNSKNSKNIKSKSSRAKVHFKNFKPQKWRVVN